MSRAVNKERLQNLQREAKRTPNTENERQREVFAVRGAEKAFEKRAAVTALDPELRRAVGEASARESARVGGKGRRPVSILGQIHGLGHGLVEMIRAVVGLAPGQGAGTFRAATRAGHGGSRASWHVQGSFQGANCPRPSTSSALSRSMEPTPASMVSFWRPLVDESRGPEARDPNRSKLGPTDPAMLSGSLGDGEIGLQIDPNRK